MLFSFLSRGYKGWMRKIVIIALIAIGLPALAVLATVMGAGFVGM